MGSRASLNHIYRTVWNQALGAMVAVAEVASGRGKSSGSSAASAGQAYLLQPSVVRIGLSAFAIACAWGSVTGTALANPNGGVAIHGQATQTTNGNQLLVTTQNGAGTSHSAINWQSFSIPAGSSTYFQQPGVASTVINRVVTNTPSLIFGTLGSNGNVVLVNQSGITVGAGALVDTAGFTASALRMTDADAIAGRLRFGDSAAATGAVSVQGSILARSGDVVLIGSNVNTGSGALVKAPNGNTLLAAGQQIEITGRGLEGISMVVQAPTDSAVNLGTLNGDAVGIFAGTLKTAGAIAATAVTAEGGKVYLKAADMAEVGGSVSAKAKNGLGGVVHVSADKVVVKAGANIDVSGQSGGGEALIGGGYQGKDARLANARRTLVEAGASINADAITAGNGGTVVVWSDDATAVHGSIFARGGSQGGDGGLIETSGHALDVSGIQVSASAARGKSGTWLLDPADIVIGANSNNVADTSGGYGSPVYEGSGDGASIAVGALLSVLNGGTNVTVKTTSGSPGSGVGNITVNSSIIKTTGADATLTLDAYNDIVLSPGVVVSSTAPSGALNVTLQSSVGAVTTTGATIATKGGDLNVQANGNITTGVITTLGGDVSLNSNNGAVNTSAATISTAGGGVGINASDNVTVGQVLAGGGNVSLSSTQGNISQTGSIVANLLTADAGDCCSGGTITLTSTTNNIARFDGYGTSITLRNASSSLGIARASAWNGNISITNTGGINIENSANGATIETETDYSFSSTASVTLTSTAGAITSSAITHPAIISNEVVLNAATGIGSAASPVTITVDTNASSPISLEFVNGSGDVYVSGSGDMIVQASQSGGSMKLVANNNLNIFGNLTATAGDISLDAGAGDGNIDLDADDINTVLSAGRDVLISSQGSVDANGYSSISAGRDVDILAGNNVDTWGPIAAGRDVVINSGGTISLGSSDSATVFSRITAQTLTTTSFGGTTLVGDGDAHANVVGSFSATNTGGGDIKFVNSGAFSLGTITNTGGGRFLIFADSPDSVTKNGVTSSFRHYGTTYGELSSTEQFGTGNGFVYRSMPTVASVNTFVASGAASHVYAQNPTVVFGYSIAGIDKEDVLGSPSFNVPVGSNTNAGSYQISYNTGLTIDPAAAFMGANRDPMVFPALTTGNSAAYTVTPRPVSTWVGSTTGLWSNPSNWDVLPNFSNVLTVSIPMGTSVEFDADAGSTSIQSLYTSGLFTVSGGALNVSASMAAGQYVQTGGAVTGDGSFTVADSFTQTGGEIVMKGAVSITQTSGDLTVRNVTGGSVNLDSKTGSIFQTGALGSTGLLKTKSVGDTKLDNVANSVAGFNATITGAGNVVFTNVGALDVTGITIPDGDLTIDHTGALKTSGAIEVPKGDVKLVTHSPMVIGSTINAGGNIVLAALTPDGSSNITVNGAMTSASGGISVQAYNNFIQNSNLSAALAIDIAAGGTVTFGPSAFSVGNPVSYTVNGVTYAPPWVASTLSGGPTSFVDDFLGRFETALNSQNLDVDDPLGLRDRAKEGVVVEGDICAR